MASTNTSKAPIGAVLAGKFRITREIGRGGMAAVYEAENVDIGKRVAVKILAPELITSKVVRERFIREARAAAGIRSPYICDVYDSGMYDDRPFLVMELLEGESLYDMMTRVRRVDIPTTLRIATHTARALQRAHEGNVVHRDLKPENIFLTKNEDGELLAKILDFGLAKFYEPTDGDAPSTRLTREGALFGTPAYMSPEQAKGQGEVDHRADLWALGCIVYECLIGQTVWNVEQGVAMILAQIAGAPLPRPTKLRPDLPSTFDTWFQRALDRDPGRRFQTAREFSESLIKALSSQETASPHSSLHSEAEGVVVDELIAGSTATPRSPTPPEASSPRTPVSPPDFQVVPSQAPRTEPQPTRAVTFLMLFAALLLGGYALWLYVLHPPGKVAVAAGAGSGAELGGSSGRASRLPNSIEGEPYARTMSQAQIMLASDAKPALEMFRTAFQDGNMPAARSLLSHATVAVEEVGGSCRVAGIGRPRPFQRDAPVSRPSLARTDKGVVFSWVDGQADSKKKQAYTVLLDAAMRRVSPLVSVTPEAENVRQPQLSPLANKLALLYWDEGGQAPGVYVRLLDSEGRILGPARRISEGSRGDYPVLVAAPGGEAWAIWEEELDGVTSDIVARRLGPELEPKAPPVRLTALKPVPGVPRQPRTPDATIEHGRLYVVFAKEVGSQRLDVMMQTIALEDVGLVRGVKSDAPPPKTKKKKKGGKNRVGEAVGTLAKVSSASSKNAQPRIACATEGCYVAWDDEKAGALTAFVDRDRGPIWHREFASKGSRPSVARGNAGVVVAWYEESRVKMAPLTRDGPGKTSTLTRVNGFQPHPDLSPGNQPGEWYLAFRDYEAAHLEAFGLHAECR